jgi:hypothetical protein
VIRRASRRLRHAIDHYASLSVAAIPAWKGTLIKELFHRIGKHAPSLLIGPFQGSMDIGLRLQKQRHIGKRIADRERLDMDGTHGTGVERRERQRLDRELLEILNTEFVPNCLGDALRIALSRRKQVD